MDALVNSRVAELEHLRTVALRDLEEAQEEINRLEFAITLERLDSRRAYRLEEENRSLRERVAELESEHELLSVSPVLPAVSVKHQKDLVRQAEEWQDMTSTITELREDNSDLFERVRRLTKENDDLLKSPLLMARTPCPRPLVESRAADADPVLSALARRRPSSDPVANQSYNLWSSVCFIAWISSFFSGVFILIGFWGMLFFGERNWAMIGAFVLMLCGSLFLKRVATVHLIRTAENH